MKRLAIAGLSAICTMATITAVTVPVTPAAAIPVFDAGNYAQNVLTAARTLQQINQQIQSLQNEATMLSNMGKNLSRIDFPQLDRLRERLTSIDRLMGQAQGVDFRIDTLDAQFRKLFPREFDTALNRSQRVIEARGRLDAAMDAFKQSMGVQSQIVENVQDDARTLSELVDKSQGAEGSLQAAQATNQLLALTAKQQFQIQNLMASQFRSQAVEAARRAQAEAEAKTATKKFLGSGAAYTPQ